MTAQLLICVACCVRCCFINLCYLVECRTLTDDCKRNWLGGLGIQLIVSQRGKLRNLCVPQWTCRTKQTVCFFFFFFLKSSQNSGSSAIHPMIWTSSFLGSKIYIGQFFTFPACAMLMPEWAGYTPNRFQFCWLTQKNSCWKTQQSEFQSTEPMQR